MTAITHETPNPADSPLTAETAWQVVTALVLAIEERRRDVEEHIAATPDLAIYLESQATALNVVCKHINDAHMYGAQDG